MPFVDNAFDAVLSTLTLCTISDVDRAVAEVHRVLKPGECFRFVEHGRAPDRGVAHWERRLDPLQGLVFAGCHLTRDIPGLLAGAGFTLNDLQAASLPGPRAARPWTYLYQGRARKSALMALI